MQIVMPCLSLPKYVESLLTTYYTVVLDWFSGQVYANLLKRDPQHLLVQLSKQIKWVTVQTCSKNVTVHRKLANKSVEFRRKTSLFICAIYRGVVFLPQV